MPASAQFHFNNAPAIQHVRDISHRTLSSAGELGHAFWDQIAPVGRDPRSTGSLRASWFHYVTDSATGVTLVIGASAKHAIFVELGVPSRNQPPQAPLRTTAGEVVAIIPSLFEQEVLST